MQNTKREILEAGAKYFGLAEVKSRLPQQVQDDIASGKKEFALAEYYFRKKLDSLGGIQSVIKSTDVKVAGVTNLDKGFMPEGVFMAVLGVSVAYGYHASSVEATAPRYSNSEYLNTIPTRLHNSEARISIGEQSLLAVRTRRFFANAYAEYATATNEENMVMLPQPKLASHKKAFNVEFEFPNDAVATPANNHFVEITFIGVEIKDRPAA